MASVLENILTKDNVAKQFCEYYEGNLDNYKALSGIIEDVCKQMLKHNKILSQVSSRSKSRKRLGPKAEREATKLKKDAEKLEKKVAELQKKIQNIEKDGVESERLSALSKDLSDTQSKILSPTEQFLVMLNDKIADLAGARILVYFPEDVTRVVEMINSADEVLEVVKAVVSYTKSRSDYRAKDRAEQESEEDGELNYTDGPWFSQVSPTEAAQRWKHSGYRAIHLHVKLAEELRDQWATAQWGANEFDSESDLDGESMPNEAGPDRNLQLSLKTRKSKFRKVTSKDLTDKLVEIQITTVVMHAWSQVEHDVIYKNPFKLPINATMMRMLDGVNGLSITSEIMLDELGRTITEVKQEAIHDNEKFSSLTEFSRWLRKLNQNDMNAARRESDPQWIIELYEVLKFIPFSPFSTTSQSGGLTTPALLRKFIEKSGILKASSRSSERRDISSLILKALTFEKTQETQGLMACDHYKQWHSREKASPENAKISLLYKLLLVSNAVSIMFAVDGTLTDDWLKDAFEDYDSCEIIGQINAIIRGTQTASMTKNLKKLEDYSELFLSVDWLNIHELAVSFAHLGYFLIGLKDTLSNSSQEKKFQASQKLHFRPLVFKYLRAIQPDPDWNFNGTGLCVLPPNHRIELPTITPDNKFLRLGDRGRDGNSDLNRTIFFHDDKQQPDIVELEPVPPTTGLFGILMPINRIVIHDYLHRMADRFFSEKELVFWRG